MLAGSLQSSDIAAVLSTSGRINTGFTHDRHKLQDAIMNLQQQQTLYHQQDCPDLDHYQAYMVHDRYDPMALEAAAAEAARCFPGITPQMAEGLAKSAAASEMSRGEQGTRVALDVIKQVIRQMGALAGQHTLVLISPGFIALTPEATQAKAQVMDTAAQANVTVSALDARGLYTYMLDAGKKGESLVQEQDRRNSLNTFGDVMADLASGTGGNYYHNSNDLTGGFERLTKAPEYLYLLEFSPQGVTQDGTYHSLKVKVNVKGAKIRSRAGYFAEKPTPVKASESLGWLAESDEPFALHPSYPR